MSKKHLICGLAVAGMMAAAPAFAQTRAPWSGDFWGYVGASAGESKFRADCSSLFDCDKKDTGWRVYAGGKMNDYLGLEVGYVDFGQIRASGGEVEAWAVPLTLTVGMPLGERFSVFAKGGGLYGRTDVRVDPTTLLDEGHKSGWGWTYGVGGGFAIAQNLMVRLDWDRHKLDFIGGRRDVDMWTAGLQFRF